jgi:EAL domain-containing protein (putative c-di-GMP-specific phosphodiesterase class I)/PleD family two-component response regulator
MNAASMSLTAEQTNAQLRVISKRIELIGRRLRRFLNEGWDINGLALLSDDVQNLTPLCREHDLQTPAIHLESIHRLLQHTVSEQALPDPATGERLRHLMEALQTHLPSMAEEIKTNPGGVSSSSGMAHSARAETPPAVYWRRWGADAPPAQPVQVGLTVTPETVEEFDPWSSTASHYGKLANPQVVSNANTNANAEIDISDAIFDEMLMAPNIGTSPSPVSMPTPTPAAQNPMASAGLEDIDATEILTQIIATQDASNTILATDISETQADTSHLPVGKNFRIYHLTAYGPISLALDQRFELQGLELELLEDVSELKELLSTFPADLVVIDAEFSQHIESLGQEVRSIRQRNQRKLTMVALSNADDITIRLSARRAGVDSLIVGAKSVEDVLKRLRDLLDPNREAAYRVMIIEDDRSQAMFAESILRNNGMETMVVLESMQVLPALESFQPDLLLMDLNMPGANGIELTSLIREQEDYMHTPIVFLSGEHDEDRQFDAIDAGGDDFLSKPIRPRHLISAVQNRVRRHRAMSQRQTRRSGMDPTTGLFERHELMSMVNATLSSTATNKTGGVLFLEIENLASLRERLGITAFDKVQTELIKLINQHNDGLPTARFGDGSFMIYSATLVEAELEAIATRCRSAIIDHDFEVQGRPMRLSLSIGICGFSHPFIDGIHLLNAVEKACHEARTGTRGIQFYQAPKAEEAERETSLLRQLRQSLEHESLELLYQPVVAVAGGEETQYQTLLRLRDTQGKLLSAAEIIPMAERGNFITDIDRWVLLRAIQLIHSRSEEQKNIRLFVSQSAITLMNPTQVQWLKKEIDDSGIVGSSLVIEIRMEDAVTHSREIKNFCDSVTPDGVQFCLSQCELNGDIERLIEAFPLGFVKLSRKYSAASQMQPVRDELKTLINRAHRRGLEVIGTGVEDPQAAATLWMSGIDFIQGNLVQQADHSLQFDFQQAVL